MSDKRLWEFDHPYYCNEGNYFSTGCGEHYNRWQDFVASDGALDLDLNLVFRFDWIPPYAQDDNRKPIQWQGDENYRDCTLKLFYMGQRKGFYRWVTIDVCRADEPAVRAWLEIRWQHMRKLWEPLSGVICDRDPGSNYSESLNGSTEKAKPAELREWWVVFGQGGAFLHTKGFNTITPAQEEIHVREVPSPERVRAALDAWAVAAGWHDWKHFKHKHYDSTEPKNLGFRTVELLRSLGIDTEGV